jgi:CRISPR-associated endoribonuclease Cas6
MRIYLNATPNTETVPFNYQHKLVGVLHKWLGANELHGKVSLYSFSWLLNGKPTKEGLNYPNGATFFISFYEAQYVKQIIKAILDDPQMCYGMSVVDVTIEDEPDFSNLSLFRVASPIFIHRYNDDNNKHYTYNDSEAGELMKETLLHKMQLAGLAPDDTLKIKFDTSYFNKKLKLIDYRGIKNRVNFCPIIIEAKPETKAFAWAVGLGNSTGIGFGSIY